MNEMKCVDVHQEEQKREVTAQQKPFKRGESVEKANVSERRSKILLWPRESRTTDADFLYTVFLPQYLSVFYYTKLH